MRKALLTVMALTLTACPTRDEERVTTGSDGDPAGDESGESGKPEAPKPPAAAGETGPAPALACVDELAACASELAECKAAK